MENKPAKYGGDWYCHNCLLCLLNWTRQRNLKSYLNTITVFLSVLFSLRIQWDLIKPLIIINGNFRSPILMCKAYAVYLLWIIYHGIDIWNNYVLNTTELIRRLVKAFPSKQINVLKTFRKRFGLLSKRFENGYV